MNRSIGVLSVPHQLHGPRFPGYVGDPSYESLVEDLIGGVDFVFEEAAGCRPSVAEKFGSKVLGGNRYLDVDPQRGERKQYGIAEETSKDYLIDAGPDYYRCQFAVEHGKREKVWLGRILDQQFEKGLLVCGSAHGLSFVFRLEAAGFGEVKLYEYIPYHKL